MKARRSTTAHTPAGFDAALDSERTPLDWPRHTGHLERVMEAIAVRKKRARRRRVQIAAGAVSALLVLGIAALRILGGERADTAAASRSHAVVVAPARQTLPDGSIAELKDGSEIIVDFGGPLRRVALRQGEVHFQVAKNPQRAFVVEAGGMEFRAVGTAFDVQLSATRVRMLVTEGRVTVERAGVESALINSAVSAPPPRVIVDAGHQVAVNLADRTLAALRVTPLSSAESDENLAWRRVPLLELSDTPLAEVAAAINRYSSAHLELGDADLGKVEISGTLRADNVETLLRMLKTNYGIRAERQDAGKIVLRKVP